MEILLLCVIPDQETPELSALAVFSQNLWVINSKSDSFSWTFLVREKMFLCQQSEWDPLVLWPLAAPTGPSGGQRGGFPHLHAGVGDNFCLGGRREGAASTEIRVGKRIHCWTWDVVNMIPRDSFSFVICPPGLSILPQ